MKNEIIDLGYLNLPYTKILKIFSNIPIEVRTNPYFELTEIELVCCKINFLYLPKNLQKLTLNYSVFRINKTNSNTNTDTII